MWLSIYFILGTLESLGIFLYSLLEYSSSGERVVFNFSLERLVLVFILFLIVCLFACLAVKSIIKKLRKEPFLEKLLDNEGILWAIMAANIFASILIVFLFIQPHAWFRDFLAIFMRLRPTLFWILILNLQTLFFAILWYAVKYVGSPADQTTALSMRELRLVLLVFLASMLIKILFVLPNGFGLLKDVGETKYLYMLQYLSEGIFFQSATEFTTHYPWLYPLSLMFTFFIKNYAFEWIKIQNALYAASAVFPLYLISRRLLSRNLSLVVIGLASLVPFQFLLPIRLLSENLYYPLFMWAIYLVFTAPKNGRYRLAWDCLTGFTLGLLYATRYISLALIPFFLFVWWLKPFTGARGIYHLYPRKILHAILIILMAAAVYSPWVLIGLQNGLTLAQMLGFGIAADTNPQQLTLINLMKWVLFYAGYFILLAAPVLNLIFITLRSSLIEGTSHRRGVSLAELVETNKKIGKSTNTTDRNSQRRSPSTDSGIASGGSLAVNLPHAKAWGVEADRWLVLVLILAAAFTMAVVRHSWRADYNLDLPQRLMGRYITYFVPLFLISAFLSFKQFDRKQYQSWRHFAALNEILPLVMVLFCYSLIVKGSILPVGADFIHPLISIDAVYIQYLGSAFFILILVLYTGTNLLLWQGRRAVVTFAGAVLSLFFLFGEPAYLHFMAYSQTGQALGKLASDVMLATNHQNGQNLDYEIFLPEGLTRDQLDDAAWSIFIRNMESNWTVSGYSDQKVDKMQADAGIVIRPENEASDLAGVFSYDVVEVNGVNYAIELLLR